MSKPQTIFGSSWLPVCCFSCENHTQLVLFSSPNLVIAPKTSVKYLSCRESGPLKPLFHFSTVRLGKRLVRQQIQVSVGSKHFTSHCTTSPSGGGPISTSLHWLHSPLAQHPHIQENSTRLWQACFKPPYNAHLHGYGRGEWLSLLSVLGIVLCYLSYIIPPVSIWWYFINYYLIFLLFSKSVLIIKLLLTLNYQRWLLKPLILKISVHSNQWCLGRCFAILRHPPKLAFLNIKTQRMDQLAC